MMRRLAGSVLLFLIATVASTAQELEPKAYSASPVGATFLVAAFSSSSGGVVFDPALPVSDVHANVQGLAFAVGHTLNVFGDLALVTLAVPAASARVTGSVMERSAEVERSGLADTRFKFSINLFGNPALTPREFARVPRRTIVGASIELVAPSGQYDRTKLINLGTNRWSFKPEVGISWPKGPWDFDAYVGAWFYTANADFFPATGCAARTPCSPFRGTRATRCGPACGSLLTVLGIAEDALVSITATRRPR